MLKPWRFIKVRRLFEVGSQFRFRRHIEVPINGSFGLFYSGFYYFSSCHLQIRGADSRFIVVEFKFVDFIAYFLSLGIVKLSNNQISDLFKVYFSFSFTVLA